jgi:hypothetical protein
MRLPQTRRRSERCLVSLVVLCICTATLGSLQAAKMDAKDKIPDDFPKDFPIYKNATVSSYGPIIRSNPTLGNVLVLETPDPKDSVLAFYRTELPSNGWTLETFSGAPDSLAASKDGRRISVNVSESQSGAKRTTVIHLGVNTAP